MKKFESIEGFRKLTQKEQTKINGGRITNKTTTVSCSVTTAPSPRYDTKSDNINDVDNIA
jgi:hypothetical protein